MKPTSCTKELERVGVKTYSIPFNRNDILRDAIKSINPDIALFDRFIAEEGYSHVVNEVKPDCLRILDQQDFHSLRQFREETFPTVNSISKEFVEMFPSSSHSDLLRELASIHRSDLVIVCSSPEWRLLTQEYGINPKKLVTAPLFGAGKQNPYSLTPVDTILKQHSKYFYRTRGNFVTIGNWKHSPNLDSAVWMVKEVWPLIRGRLPQAQLHLYGARPTSKTNDLHNPEQGVFFLGHLSEISRLSKYRAMLCPLRFGAGVKGKIADSWYYSTPVITTLIGREGLTSRDVPWACDAGNQDWEVSSLPEGYSLQSFPPYPRRGSLIASKPSSPSPQHRPRITPLDLSVTLPPPTAQQQQSDISDASLPEPSPLPTSTPSISTPSKDRRPSPKLSPPLIHKWGGLVSSQGSAQEIADLAVEIYTNKELWYQCSAEGSRLLSLICEPKRNFEAVYNAVSRAYENMSSFRQRSYSHCVIVQETMKQMQNFSRSLETHENMNLKLQALRTHISTLEAQLAMIQGSNLENQQCSSPHPSPPPPSNNNLQPSGSTALQPIHSQLQSQSESQPELELELESPSDIVLETESTTEASSLTSQASSPPLIIATSPLTNRERKRSNRTSSPSSHPKGWLFEDDD